MKIKNSKIIDSINAINNIGILTKAPKALFALSKNLNKLNILLNDIDEPKKKLWITNFGNEIEVQKEHKNYNKYNKEYQEILDIEIDFDPFKFKKNDINLETNSLSPYILSSISWLIEDFDDDLSKPKK